MKRRSSESNILSSKWLPRLLAVLFLFLPIALHAQFSASLSGTVEDNTGAVIPNATLTLTQDATQAKKTTTASGEGSYRFNELAPGSYTLNVSAPGFKPSTTTGVMVSAETPRGVDVHLDAGPATSSSVTVNANTLPALQTEDASVSATISSEAVERLPSFGADPYELLRTAPGISGDSARSGSGEAIFLPNGAGPGQSNSGIYQTENQVQISAAGQPVQFNSYLIDGVSVNSLGRGGAAVVTPNIESVSAITVISTSFDAEDGRNSGAQVKTVTKSGSNDFHGSLRFQYDEPGLNAYNSYTGPQGEAPTRVDNKQRYEAGSLGGPIWKDKAFFFVSGEAFQEFSQTFSSQFVETPEYRAALQSLRGGSVSALTVAGAGAPRVSQILQQTCATYGTTDPRLCNPVGDGLDVGSPYGVNNQYVPLSTGGGCTYLDSNGNPACITAGMGLDGVPDLQFVEIESPSRTRARQYNARFDVNATSRDSLFTTFFFTKLDNNNPSGTAGSRPGDDIPFKPLNSAVTAGWIHSFSPKLINELRANFTRFSDNGITDAAGQVNYGIPYINIQNEPFGQYNDVQFGVNAASTTPSILAQNTYELRDVVSKIFGNHSLRMGFQYRIEQDNNNLAGNDRPTYAFAGIWNFFNNTPIYEGITANPANGGPGETQRYFRDHYFGAFGQDDWKVAPNLTVNLGLRWEYFEPFYNQGFPVNLPVLGATGNELIGASLTLHNHFYNSELHDFSPKFGFAWTPRNNPNMVVRGGFAMAYNRLPASLFDPALENGPGVFNFGLCCGTAVGDFGSPYANGTIQYSVGSTTSPFSYPANPALVQAINPATGTPQGLQVETYGAGTTIHTPYEYLYGLEVQRNLGRDWVFSVGYQGSKGYHLPRLVQQGFLYPSQSGTCVTLGQCTIGVNQTPFYAAYLAQTDSIQNYNGMNVQLRRNFANGVSFSAIYTWSRALDEISNGDGANAAGNQTFPQINRYNYGPADYDLNSRFVGTAVWNVPDTHHNNAIAKAALNGWQVNGIFTAHTGFPFTPVTYAINGQTSAATPNLISPIRPLTYTGGFPLGSSCGNSQFEQSYNGNQYFDVGLSGPQPNITPGIGRNSFRGPCYKDVDLSVAKQFKFEMWGHTPLLRFQANAYNLFNYTNLTPILNGNSSPSAVVESSIFGHAQTADAGRVVEFLARFQF